MVRASGRLKARKSVSASGRSMRNGSTIRRVGAPRLLDVGRFDRRDEAVAPAREGFDELRRLGVVAQRLADLPDAEVQPLVEVHERVALPHLLPNLLSCHDLAASPDQRLQDLERLRGKLDQVAVAAKLAGARMELEGPKTKDGGAHSSKTHRELSAAYGHEGGTPALYRHSSTAPSSEWQALRNRYSRRWVMALRIGDTAPDFLADTTEGPIRFHEWLGGSWGVLFSHPKDFTPVCTTELGYMARLKPEFDKRNTKIIGLSVDPVDKHKRWSDDIQETQGFAPNYPMIGDTDLAIAKAWGMLPASTEGSSEGRTAADNQTVRNVFIVGPDKKIKLIIVYPMTTGRNFDEVLRVLDSLQLTAAHKVATPVNWKPGDDVIIAGSVSDEDAKKQYPNGWKAPRPYIRIVPQPVVAKAS